MYKSMDKSLVVLNKTADFKQILFPDARKIEEKLGNDEQNIRCGRAVVLVAIKSQIGTTGCRTERVDFEVG